MFACIFVFLPCQGHLFRVTCTLYTLDIYMYIHVYVLVLCSSHHHSLFSPFSLSLLPCFFSLYFHPQEGQELLGGEQLEKTRQQTAEAAADTQKSPAKVKRTTTIAQTTSEVNSIILACTLPSLILNARHLYM